MMECYWCKENPNHCKEYEELLNKHQELWIFFINKIMLIKDPLLLSLFKRFKPMIWSLDQDYFLVTTDIKHLFFRDLIDQTSDLWMPLLKDLGIEQIHFGWYDRDAIEENDVYVLTEEREKQIELRSQPLKDMGF